MKINRISIPAFFSPDGVGEQIGIGRFDLVDANGDATITSLDGQGIIGALDVAISGKRTTLDLPITTQYGSQVFWRFTVFRPHDIDPARRLFDLPGFAVLCADDGRPIMLAGGEILVTDVNGDIELFDILDEGIDVSVISTLAHRIPMGVAALQAQLDMIGSAVQQADISDLGDVSDLTITLSDSRPIARKINLVGNGALTLEPLADDLGGLAVVVITSADPSYELTLSSPVEWVDDPMPLKPQVGYKIILEISQLFGSVYVGAIAMPIP